MNVSTDKQKYNPYWPETVVFWGAGATRSLGMMMTGDIGKVLYHLSGLENGHENKNADMAVAICKWIPAATPEVRSELKALLTIIDSTEKSDNKKKAARTVLHINVERANRLSSLYDWHALKKVIERCPGVAAEDFHLQDLYNLLDMHIKSKGGIEVDEEFINSDRLIAARRTVDMLIQLFHTINYKKMLRDKKDVYRQYYDFAKILAARMQVEGLNRINNYSLDSKNFYLFSYAVISMNWDPLLLWLIFNAHREANHSSLRPYIGTPPQPMKLFNDFAHFMAVRKVDGENPGAWFPMNETAVQRLNDPEHVTDRIVRIGKFYFPHGSHGFRQCPKCGKLTFYLGDVWAYDSDNLFPPQIIPSLSVRKPRSLEEKQAIEKGMYDAVQCTHCGQITEAHHTPIVMQTNFKGANPSFIEEIQSDMRVAIEKAKHIIFAGYSLPPDDFIYRSMLAARRKMGKEDKGDNAVKCSVIDFDRGAEDRWLYKEDLEAFHKSHSESIFYNTCQRVADIFGMENIRGYGAGFPNVFLKNGQADGEKVEEMFRIWS